MNKQANIPITILVLGVFLLCGAVLLSFTLFDMSDNGKTMRVVDSFNELNIALEKYNFYINLGKLNEEALDYLDRSFFESKILIDKESTPKKLILNDEDIVVEYKIDS